MVDIPQTETVSIELITTDGKNPNRMQPEQLEALKKNIVKFGFIIPIVTNEDLLVADGEHRLTAARSLEMTHVPVIRLPLKDVDRRTLRQVLNKLKGSHDPALDIEEYREILEADGSFAEFASLIGREEKEFSNILKKVDFIAKADEDSVPEKGAFDVHLGDLWALGDHRLICADSTKPETFGTLLGGEKFDILLTDPPYGVDYVSLANSYIKGGNTMKAQDQEEKWSDIKNDDLRQEGLQEFCENNVRALLPYAKENWVGYICFAAKNLHWLLGSLDTLEVRYGVPIVWDKDAFNISWHRYHPDYEIIVYCGPGGAPTGPKSRWFGPNNERCVWRIKRDSTASYVHPTQKPVALFERALLNSTTDGQVVLDPFAGSGTAVITAHKHNRRAFLAELSPVYCSVIMQRFKEYTGIEPTLLHREKTE